MKKITKTFSIDEKMYERFDNVCKIKKINKDLILQEYINKFIIDNYNIDDQVDYIIKNDDEFNPISIEKKENDKLFLSNGNVINIFDFEKIYEKIDSKYMNVEEETITETITETDTLSDEDFNEYKKTGKKWEEENKTTITNEEIYSYSIGEEEKIKIFNKLKHINKNIHDLTKIFKMPYLTFIRNENKLYIYHEKPINVENLSKLIIPFLKDMNITFIFFIKKSFFEMETLINNDLIKFEQVHNYFETELSNLLSKLFKTNCKVEYDKYTEKYNIYLHMKYYYSNELYKILHTLEIQDKFKFFGNGLHASKIIGDEYYNDNFSDIIKVDNDKKQF